MKTLDASLTTAQQSASSTPFIEIRLFSRDRATLYSYCTDDDPNRIVAVQQAEGTTNGHISSPADKPYSIFVRLRDHDNTLSALDLRGYRVEIGWGFKNAAGVNGVSYGPLGFVDNQRVVSLAGEVFVELFCMSVWDKLGLDWPNDQTASVLEWPANTSVRHILQEILGGVALDDAQMREDGVGWTDETADSADTTENVNIFPATPSANDAFYFGRSIRFDRLSIDLTTVGVVNAGTTGPTIAWEYYNGTAYTLLRIATTGKAAFLTGEMITIDFELPDDAATVTVNGVGPYYYIRARLVSGTYDTVPVATRIYANVDFGFQIDTADGDQGDDFTPTYKSDYFIDTRMLVQHMLEYTEMGLKVLPDGFHMVYIDVTETTPDYTYSTSHPTFSSIQSSTHIRPNKIIYVDRDPAAEDSSVVTGNDSDADSITALGTIPAIILDPSATTTDLAGTLATRHITRLKRERQQGSFIAPMNIGQEIWDLASVVDARTGNTFSGWITHIERSFDPVKARYQIQCIMGGSVAVVRPEIISSEREEVLQDMELDERLDQRLREQPSMPVDRPIPEPVPTPTPVVPFRTPADPTPSRVPTPPVPERRVAAPVPLPDPIPAGVVPFIPRPSVPRPTPRRRRRQP